MGCDNGHVVWVYDGTGARRIGDAWIPLDPFGGSKYVVLRGILYYSGAVDGSRSLWKSDGTEAGTVQLLSEGGEPFDSPLSFLIFDGRVLFHSLGRLMETDGTAVRLILESVAPDLAPVGGRLFFRHSEPATGDELWVLE